MGIAGNPSRPTAGRRPRRWPANWADSCAEPLLIDVGEAEVHAVVLFEDVIETGRDIGDGLRNRIYGVEVGIDQRGLSAVCGRGVAAYNVLASGLIRRTGSGYSE